MSSNIIAQDILTEGIANEIASYFPVLEGYVVNVKGERIYLDLGRKSEVKKGIEFLCIREGEEFSHPITGELFGRFEDKLGILQITDIEENYSIAKILQKFSKQDIKRGDKIRITAAKVPIALPPDLIYDPDLINIIKGLEKTGRFDLIPEANIKAALNKLGLSGFTDIIPANIKKIGEELNVLAFIFPSIENVDGQKIANINIVSARTGAQIAQIIQGLGTKTTALASKGTVGNTMEEKTLHLKKGYERFIIPPERDILPAATLSEKLQISIRFIAIGDITGDGKKEICLTDGQNISVFSWNQNAIKQIYHIKGTPSEDHLSLDIADINKNGRAELFISSMEKDSLRSFVLEWEGNKLVKKWDKVPLFLRIMPSYPDKKVLLGQGRGISTPFDDRIYEYVWDKDGYSRTMRMKLPYNVNIFNIAMADVDKDDQIELICMNNKLRIYRNDKEIWSSEVVYGGKTNFFEHEMKGAIGTEDEDIRIYLSSHFIIQDMNGNNMPEIILIKNISSMGKLFPRNRIYRKGEACLIEWNGISFTEVWCTGNIDAYLTDIEIGDINSDGTKELVIAMVLLEGIGRFWKKDFSRLLYY